MADKILMNKNSLAALKLELKEFNTALPVFEMKEQELKSRVQTTENAIQQLQIAIEETYQEVAPWIGVMAETTVDLSTLVRIKEVITEQQEITGVTIDIYRSLTFEDVDVDEFNTSLWIDAAVEVIKTQFANQEILKIEERNLEKLLEELAEARRMKNALKEVFIPETRENIRKIEIYLGDVERLAIGCAKLVKKKKEVKSAGA
jgi:V/A-type H+-transporting ATPase subunit D